MNEDVIADLKQFIAATVSQATADIATKADLANLASKVNARFDGMATQIDELKLNVNAIADAHAESLEDHEQRLRRLEQHTA